MARQVSQVSPYLGALATPCHRQLAHCRYQLLPSPLHLPPSPSSPWNRTNLTLNLQTFSSSRLCKLFSKTNSSNSHAATNRNLADPALGSSGLTVVMADRCDFAISISCPLASWAKKAIHGIRPLTHNADGGTHSLSHLLTLLT